MSQEEILEILTKANKPLSIHEICANANCSRSSVHLNLLKLQKYKEVRMIKKSTYNILYEAI